MYDAIRAKYPTIPYIMLSRPDYFKNIPVSIARRQVVIDTFHYAVANCDKNVYYIDGASMFRGPFEDCCTVDGVHPNDLGFSKMAEAVYAVLHRALRDQTLLK
jgi:lysophospholipase L1-like esterase